MTAEEIEAIVGGYHGDAFRVLGPHGWGKKNQQAKWEVRAFLPQAESAAVVLAGGNAVDAWKNCTPAASSAPSCPARLALTPAR